MPAKKLYTLKEISAAYGRAVTTTHDHIKKFMLKGKFQKQSADASYTDEEIKILEKLMGFKIQR